MSGQRITLSIADAVVVPAVPPMQAGKARVDPSGEMEVEKRVAADRTEIEDLPAQRVRDREDDRRRDY